jgi:hypothetical protein
MARSTKRNKKKNSQEKTIGAIVMEYIKSNYGKAIIFVIGIVVTLILTKACDKIVPSQPVVVEKVPDTIQVVYVYDSLFDSATKAYLQQSEEMIKTNLKNQSRRGSTSTQSYTANVNNIFPSAKFPNAKGYSTNSAAPYFSLEMSPLDQSFIDFSFSFFNEKILDEIYCISLKVFSIENGGGRVYILDENYEKQKGRNIIRLKNILTSGRYEVEVGFFLKKDINAQYPAFYREAKYINKSNN